MPEKGDIPQPKPKSVSWAHREPVLPPSPKEFTALTAPNKVKAILAGVREPVSQEMIYDFAGIEPEKLTDKEKDAVTAIFSDPRVQHRRSEEFQEEQYSIDPEKQQEVFQELGIDSSIADAQIADYFLEQLGRYKKDK